MAAFHVLPLSAKLRLLAEEKLMALALLGGAFSVGAGLVLGIVLEALSL